MNGDADWMRLCDAVTLLERGAGGKRSAKTMLAEWLSDGLVAARADRLIEYRLAVVETSTASLDEAISAGVLPRGELPMEILTEAPHDMRAFKWSPIPADIADWPFWENGKMTCADDDGTRARREYIGVKVERSKLLAAAAMYDVPCGTSMVAGGVDCSNSSSDDPAPDSDKLPTDDNIRRFIVNRQKTHGAIGRVAGNLTRELKDYFDTDEIVRKDVESIVAQLRSEGMLPPLRNGR